MTDADAHKDGIGPCFCEFSHDMSAEWWSKWRDLVNVTKYGQGYSEFCPLSPWNLRDDEYDKYKGTHGAGSCSIDALYISCA